MTEAELQIRIRRGESFLIAADGQFLGILSSQKFQTESVMNEYGSYGSSYSSTSIFNRYCNYGNEYNSLSPFNSYSHNPPRVFVRGSLIGYLTVNRFISNRIDPHELFDFILRQGL